MRDSRLGRILASDDIANRPAYEPLCLVWADKSLAAHVGEPQVAIGGPHRSRYLPENQAKVLACSVARLIRLHHHESATHAAKINLGAKKMGRGGAAERLVLLGNWGDESITLARVPAHARFWPRTPAAGSPWAVGSSTGCVRSVPRGRARRVALGRGRASIALVAVFDARRKIYKPLGASRGLRTGNVRCIARVERSSCVVCK